MCLTQLHDHVEFFFISELESLQVEILKVLMYHKDLKEASSGTVLLTSVGFLLLILYQTKSINYLSSNSPFRSLHILMNKVGNKETNE